MASPNVAGSLLLLQQHANNVNGNFYRAATIKGLALHTADDAGTTGPDAKFGWGLMNAKRAAETISGNGTNSLIQETTLSSSQTKTFEVTSNGTSPLIASISWTDPAGTATSALNNTTPRLVNDLDIRVTKGSTTYLPWRLTGVTTNDKGDNIRDPYERVDIASASGTYTITVTHKGSLSGGSQNFSLIVTGIAQNVSCTATVPSGLAVTSVGETNANITWNAVAGATYDLRYRVTGSSTWNNVSVSTNSYAISGLTQNTQYEVQVRSKCSSSETSAYSSSVTFTTASQPSQSYCASKGNSVSDEYIGRVQLNTINNASTGGGGYSDFTGISTNLSKGSNYTITITPTWTGTTYAEGFAVWIDYNQNGSFNDSGELVYSRSASTASPASGSFTVATAALNGATRMRVSMKYNGIPTSCETFSYGEVEDYTVIIGGSSTPPVEYCASKGNNVSDEWIQRVQLGSINNNSGKNNGYGNFVSQSTNLTKGVSNSIIITPAWSGSTYNEGYAVWIDYNQNGSFNDSGELVYSRSATNASSVTGSFTVPASAQNGSTRMRVSMKYNGIPTSCETFSYGEVEDYTVVISANGGNSTQSMDDAFASMESVSIYPNPVKDILNINAVGKTVQSLKVYDLSGKIVIESKQSQDKVDVTKLQPGVYLIEIMSNGDKTVKRFIKK